MSFWKKFFKKSEKKNQKHHDEEMQYLARLEKKMKQLERKLKKKKWEKFVSIVVKEKTKGLFLNTYIIKII